MQRTERSQPLAQPLAHAAVFSRLLLGAVILLAISIPANPARAQEAAEQAATAPPEEAARPTFELGKFKIHDFRPTRNETTKITFTMHLALSPTFSQQQVTQLERWQHRLRDQVIIAIRTLEVKEFQEADLSRLQRKVLLRVNRLFKAKLAEEVLLTEYLFRTN